MAYGYYQERGIYCIETVWEDANDRSSVRVLLELLESYCGAPFSHHDAATTNEFHYYLNEWLRQGDERYPILYLAFHGSKEGKIWFKTLDGKSDLVNYEVIYDRLENQCQNTVVHFAACSTLRDMDTRKFLRRTAASAVSGYKEDVYWIQSAAFDLLYLEELQYHGQKSLTRNVAEQVKKRILASGDPYAGLRKHLKFEMTTT